MKTIFVNLALILIIQIMILPAQGQRRNTPDYWQCDNRIGGEWNFGRVPSACDLQTLLDPDLIEDIYGPVVFDDSENRSLERERYMDSLQTVIRDAAIYYIEQRKPSIGNDELSAWVKAMYTLANSESFWSHYRLSSTGRMKITRGDFGHGHGLMQVDDRWHFNAVKDGDAWDLIFNFKYGMDIFYNEWQRAAQARCVSSPNNWTQRTRAAWAAFNGGPSKLCRWTNPNDRWARNDINFYAKLRAEAWDRYIEDYNQPAPIDIPCLFESDVTNCSDNGDPNTPIEEQLIRYSNGHQCLIIDDQMQCTYDEDNFTCLARYFDKEPQGVYQANSEDFEELTKTYWVTNFLCEETFVDLYSYGQPLVTKKRINLRETPSGKILSVIPLNTVVTSMGYKVDDFQLGKRWYRVTYENSMGFIYGGDDRSARSWIDETDQLPDEEGVPKSGERLLILNDLGINLRNSIGGTLIKNIPKGSSLEIEERQFVGPQKRLYYRVQVNGQQGWIYGGQGLPTPTYQRWAKVGNNNPYLVLSSNYYYRFLKNCPDENCKSNSQYIRSEKLSPSADRVTLLSQHRDWLEVRVERTGKSGWIQAHTLIEVK